MLLTHIGHTGTDVCVKKRKLMILIQHRKNVNLNYTQTVSSHWQLLLNIKVKQILKTCCRISYICCRETVISGETKD